MRVDMRRAGVLAVLALGAAGCVTTSTFDAKVAELEAVTADHDKTAAEHQHALEARIKGLEDTKAVLEKRLAEATAQQEQTAKVRDELRKHLDDSAALVAELTKRLEKLGQNVDKLTSERGQLSASLDDTKARLEELRKQKAVADAMAATFKGLVERLKKMIDAGQLKVVLREGRMLIALPNDVLFDSGRTSLKPDAQAALTAVAGALGSIGDRHFLVAGHTDDVPIHTAQFPSNWELSTARAVEVTKYLVSKGMKPQALSAAGHGEFDPVAPNDSNENRALNRRIEIVVQPNLSELPSIEGLLTKQ